MCDCVHPAGSPGREASGASQPLTAPQFRDRGVLGATHDDLQPTPRGCFAVGSGADTYDGDGGPLTAIDGKVADV